MFDSVDIY